MCRLLLIINNKLDKNIIKKFLKQSILIKNTPGIEYKYDKNFHKQGYGFAWKSDKKWNIYKKPLCFSEDKYNDEILNKITKNKLSNKILIGHIRSNKNLPFKKKLTNTHPFKYEENIWCHNGIIEDFVEFKKNNMINIKKEYISNIKGNTDSEFIFYLFLSLLNNNNINDATILFFNILNKYNKKISANIIFSNNKYVLVSRYINKNNIGPSLYYSTDNNFIISSEPITSNYDIVKNNSAILFDYQENRIINKFDL